MTKAIIELLIVLVFLIMAISVVSNMLISELKYKKFCRFLNPFNDLYKDYLKRTFKNYGNENIAYQYAYVCEQTLFFVKQLNLNQAAKSFMIKYLEIEIARNDDRKDVHCEDCNTPYKVGENLCFIDDIFKHSST